MTKSEALQDVRKAMVKIWPDIELIEPPANLYRPELFSNGRHNYWFVTSLNGS